MTEYVKKVDVLEIMNAPLPKDIAVEYIYDLKGVWLDEDEINTPQIKESTPQEYEKWLFKKSYMNCKDCKYAW